MMTPLAASRKFCIRTAYPSSTTESTLSFHLASPAFTFAGEDEDAVVAEVVFVARHALRPTKCLVDGDVFGDPAPFRARGTTVDVVVREAVPPDGGVPPEVRLDGLSVVRHY